MTELERTKNMLYQFMAANAILAILATGLLIAYMNAENNNRYVYNELSSRCVEPAFFDRESLSCVITYQVP